MCSYPPKVLLHLCPAGTERLFAAPFGFSSLYIFSPQNELNLSRGATVHTALGPPWVLSLCFPPSQIELLLLIVLHLKSWKYVYGICSEALRFMFLHMQQSLSESLSGWGQYVCAGHVFHTFRQVFISKHFTKSSSTVGEPPHTTPNSIPCFFAYWSNILNSFGINRT